MAAAQLLSLTVALHRGGVHGDGGWLGPILVVLLLIILAAVVLRGKRP